MQLVASLKPAMALALTAGSLAWAISPASAQDLTFTFTNPSFGGNPFNSEHLLAIANLNRPEAPEDPEEPPPSPEDLLVSQLQAQLNSSLSSNILRAIQTAQPGQSGQFVLGDTQVTYVRSATETRVKFVNSKTGETREIVIPVSPTGSPLTGAANSRGTAESVLSAAARSPLSSNSAEAGGELGSLLAPPPL